MEKIFVTAINCIDGRVQTPLINFMLERFNADFVDMITEPGPDKVLSENIDNQVIESIKSKILLSVNKHNSKVIVIAGHYDCAANTVDKENHLEQIKQSVENIKKWGFDAEVFGVWIDNDWQVVLI